MRRPSAALVVAVVALFVALGGAGYAAFVLPPASVGTAQLRNGAVNASKINRTSVQARVLGTCTTNGGTAAIAAIDGHGNATCAGTRPAEVDTATGQPVPVGVPGAVQPTPIVSLSLSGALSQFVQAAPYIQVTGASGDQHVDVACTLAATSASGAAPLRGYSETRTQSFDLATAHETQEGSIPLTITEPGAPGTVTVSLACAASAASGTLPSILVTSSINALQTGGNTTETGTTTTNTTTTATG